MPGCGIIAPGIIGAAGRGIDGGGGRPDGRGGAPVEAWRPELSRNWA